MNTMGMSVDIGNAPISCPVVRAELIVSP